MTSCRNPRSGLRRHRPGAYLALFAMLLQIGLGAVFAPALAAWQPGERILADGSRILLICTGRGLTRIAVDPEGQVRELPDDPAGAFECPLSLLSAAPALAPPTLAPVAAPRQGILRADRPRYDIISLPRDEARRPPGRAPPV